MADVASPDQKSACQATQAAPRRVRLTFLLAEPAQPSAPDVAGAMPAERVMHMIDQAKRALEVAPVADRALETEKIAHRERVRSKGSDAAGGRW